MSTMNIPSWNPSGVLPPCDVLDPTSPNRSPCKAALTDLVLRFSTSNDRVKILKGFLDFRKALHDKGLVRGFQWLDGSFLESIETTEGRAPGDIDVVTFYYLPSQTSQEDLYNSCPGLFDRDHLKRDFLVDGYFINLESSNLESLVERSAYWYSLWSHRRNNLWKGFLHVDLAPNEDPSAVANIEATINQAGGQS